MTVQELSNEICGFIKAYMLAFGSTDGVRIAALYHAPCVTVRADGSVHCLANSDELRSFFQKLVDVYHRDGCQRWRYSDLEVVAIGARSALATVEWDMLRGDGTMIRRWRQSYNLLRIGTEWKILASTFHQS